MSTKSLSFLKSAASASFISIITGLLFNTVMQSAHSLWETLLERFNPKLKKEDKADSIEPKKRGKKTKNANTDKEIPEIEADPQKPANDKEVIFGFQNKMKGWLRGRLIYIIPTFIVLVFAMLIPSARASGKVDSENAIQNAPLGRVLLNQPSIPELSPQISTTQNNDLLYDYGMLPVIGTLGDNYLLVLDRPNGKKNILSVPVAQIVSINYVNFVSLTAVPTITATPVKVSSSTPTPP